MERSRGLACLGLLQSDGFPRDDSMLLKLAAGSASNRRKVGTNDETEVESAVIAPRLEVRPSRGKGSGLFTLDDISAYSRVLAEDALLSLGEGEDLPELWEKYSALPEEDKADFDALSCPQVHIDKEHGLSAKLRLRGYEDHVARQMARISSRYHANAFGTGPNLGPSGSHHWHNCVFARIARINHSCAPNAVSHYRPNGIQAVYALQDIAQGEEIEIAYFDPTMQFSARQSRAQAWGFICACRVCRFNGTSDGETYERCLASVRWHEFSAFFNVGLAEQIASCKKAIDTAHSSEYPWLRVALSKLYTGLSGLEGRRDSNSDTVDGERRAYLRWILERILEWEEKTTGVDSPTSIQKRELLSQFGDSVIMGQN